jgi:hypothetical protein
VKGKGTPPPPSTDGFLRRRRGETGDGAVSSLGGGRGASGTRETTGEAVMETAPQYRGSKTSNVSTYKNYIELKCALFSIKIVKFYLLYVA